MTGKHGGRRTGAGRKVGALNAETLNIRELARQHAQTAIAALLEIVVNPESSQRAQASSILLDRGFGRTKHEAEPDISDVMASLKAGETTALNAALDIEGRGARLPKTVELLLTRELGVAVDSHDRRMDLSLIDAELEAAALERAKRQRELESSGIISQFET